MVIPVVVPAHNRVALEIQQEPISQNLDDLPKFYGYFFIVIIAIIIIYQLMIVDDEKD